MSPSAAGWGAEMIADHAARSPSRSSCRCYAPRRWWRCTRCRGAGRRPGPQQQICQTPGRPKHREISAWRGSRRTGCRMDALRSSQRFPRRPGGTVPQCGTRRPSCAETCPLTRLQVTALLRPWRHFLQTACGYSGQGRREIADHWQAEPHESQQPLQLLAISHPTTLRGRSGCAWLVGSWLRLVARTNFSRQVPEAG